MRRKAISDYLFKSASDVGSITSYVTLQCDLVKKIVDIVRLQTLKTSCTSFYFRAGFHACGTFWNLYKILS